METSGKICNQAKTMTQELSLRGGSSKLALPSARCTERLRRVATRTSSTGDNIGALLIADIVADPALHEEAKRLAPELADGMRRDICRNPDRAQPLDPSHPDYAAWFRIMQPLMLFAPPTKLPAEDVGKALWLRQGYEALAEMPLSILDKAVHWYIANAERAFFPAWGELKKIAHGTLTAMPDSDKRAFAGEFQAFYTIRAAARREPSKPDIVKTPEEIAAVRQMLAEFKVRPVVEQRPRETQQQMAARLRAMVNSGAGAEAF